MLYKFYMHFTLIVSVFMLSICDTEINQSINTNDQVCVSVDNAGTEQTLNIIK